MITILYVEDDPAIAELVSRKLTRRGYTVRLARNADEAFIAVASDKPGLILLDIGLGKLSPNGWEIQERLKANSETADIPVVALTAQSPTDDDRARALAAGFKEHLPKPIDTPTLLSVVASFLPPPPPDPPRDTT